MAILQRKLMQKLVIISLLAFILIGVMGCSSFSKSSNDLASISDMDGSIDENAVMFSESKSSQSKAMNATTTSASAPQASMEETPKQISNSSSSGGTSTGAGFVAGNAPPNQMLIYKGNVSMEVADYRKAYSDIQSQIMISGGYIVQFAESANSNEHAGNFTIKVPVGGFNDFIVALENMKSKKLLKSMQAQDVSEEYVDLTSRLAAKQVAEARYLEFMGRASRTDELVQFSNELSRIQEEIEQLKGRMRYLSQNVAYSTIELRVYERLSAKPSDEDLANQSLAERAAAAMKSSAEALIVMFQGVVVLLAAALPILIIFTVIAWPLWYVFRKNQHKRNLAINSSNNDHAKNDEVSK